MMKQIDPSIARAGQTRHPNPIMAALVGLCLFGLVSCEARTEAVIETSAAAANVFTEAKRVDQLIDAQMTALDIKGLSLALMQEGEISYVQTYGMADLAANRPVTEDTLFETASLSKTVFAYFALMQAEKGIIDLDKPLHTYLPHPDITDSRAQDITARMVLSHRSGFPNWRWENEDEQLDIKFDPGTQFLYSGEGFEYLAKVLANELKVDRNGLAGLIAEDLTGPLGIQRAYWVWNDDLASNVAAGYSGETVIDAWEIDQMMASASLHMTAEGYAKFVLASLRGDRLGSDFQNAFASAETVLPEDEDFRTDFGLDAWGLGVAFKQTPHGRAITHGGVNEGFTSWFTALEDQGTGYVFLTNSESGPELNKVIEPVLLELLTNEPDTAG